jgi:hypothetical protein
MVDAVAWSSTWAVELTRLDSASIAALSSPESVVSIEYSSSSVMISLQIVSVATTGDVRCQTHPSRMKYNSEQ